MKRSPSKRSASGTPPADPRLDWLEPLGLGEGSVLPMLLGLTALLVPIVPFPFVPQVYSGFGLRTHEIFPHAQALVLGALTMACLVTTPRLLSRAGRTALGMTADRLALGLGAWAALSWCWALSPSLAAHALAWIVVAACFYVAVRTALASDRVLDAIAWGTTVATALNLVFAVGQLAGAHWSLFGQGEEPIGLLGNRNHLGYYLALAIPLVALQAARRPGWMRAILNAQIALALVVTVATECRGAIVAAAAGLLLSALGLARRGVGGPVGLGPASRGPGSERSGGRIRTTPHERASAAGSPAGRRGVLLGALALTLILALAFAGQALVDPLKAGTASSRAFGWRLVASGIAQAPLAGHGLASFQVGYPWMQQEYFQGLARDAQRLERGEWRHARFFRQAHNDLMQVFYELGAVGLALALAWLVALGLCVRRALALAPGLRRDGALVGGAMLGAALAESMVGFPSQIDPTAMLILVGAALITSGATPDGVALGRVDPEAQDPEGSRGAAARRGATPESGVLARMGESGAPAPAAAAAAPPEAEVGASPRADAGSSPWSADFIRNAGVSPLHSTRGHWPLDPVDSRPGITRVQGAVPPGGGVEAKPPLFGWRPLGQHFADMHLAGAFAVLEWALALGVVLVCARDWQAQVLYARALPVVESDPARAEADLVGVLRLDPSCGQALTELGRALFAQGDLDGAAAAFEATRDLYPSASTWVNLSCVSHARSEKAAGEGHAERARQLADLSLEQTEAALALDPTSVETHYFVALARRAAGDLAGALAFLERGLSLSSADPRLGWEEAQVLLALGRRQGAVDRLGQNLGVLDHHARREDPSGRTMDLATRDWRVRNDMALARLLAELGRRPEGAVFQEEARRLSPQELQVVRN